MRSPDHFERVAATYGAARPPYPASLFEHLAAQHVIGAGRDVLEIGAGTGEATGGLVDYGCRVTAVEPGPELARQLRARTPSAIVVQQRAEDLSLPAESWDSVVAATALHWVDLTRALPRFHAALRTGGRLAVWRTTYGDPAVETPFRQAVARIVSRRAEADAVATTADPRPSEAELTAGGWFVPVETWVHRWQVDMTPAQIRSLFGTFSDWSAEEIDAVTAAAREVGPIITEHYITHLRVLRRA